MAEKSRKGFIKASNNPEWFIEGEQLCWKDPVRHSIALSDLQFINFDSYGLSLSETGKQLGKASLRKVIEMIKQPGELTPQDRYNLLHSIGGQPVEVYIKISEELLPSKKWSDGEKLVFLNSTLPIFSGRKHGKDLNKSLYRISWSSKSFRKRMLDFYEVIRRHDESRISDLDEDRKEIEEFPDTITVYRGFNIPNDESIRPRNTKLWLKQEGGKSIYFTMSPEVARWFACTQKLEVIQKSRLKINLDKNDSKVLYSRIVLAKYAVSLDNIVIYHNKAGRNERECIIIPANSDLKNYQFLGFDDFVNTVNSKGHWDPDPF